MPHLKNGSSVEEDAILEIRPEEESKSELTDEFQIFHSLNQTQWCTCPQSCLTRNWQLLGHHWKVFCYQFVTKHLRVLANQMELCSHGLSHYFKFICLQSSRIIRTTTYITGLSLDFFFFFFLGRYYLKNWAIMCKIFTLFRVNHPLYLHAC